MLTAADRSVRAAGLASLLVLTAGLTAGPLAPSLPAQEVAAQQDGGPGWLGVGLVARSECVRAPDGARERCRHELVVGSLVHGGPAHRAGLQPGDTLVAVDGTRVSDGLQDRVFRRLAPGDTVSLLVGRADGRVRLEAVPVSRPDSLAIVQFHHDGPYGESRARYVLAMPEGRALDSLVGPRDRPPTPGVRTRVSVLPAERVKGLPLRPRPEVDRALEMRRRMDAMETRARQLRRRAAEEIRELRREVAGAARAERVDPEGWKRWIAEDLQPRLQVIYDSMLTVARERMNSLREKHLALRARHAAAMDSAFSPPAPAFASDSAPSPPSPSAAAGPPPSPEALGMPANRIAGAELQPLGPELAAFFGDLDGGVLVVRVLAGTPASRLGLRPGDVIVEAGGHPVQGLAGLRRALMEGRAVAIEWVRRGRPMADTLRH